MDDRWVVVYFPRTKTVDVMNASAVCGEVTVGDKTKVKWNERMYTAKIMFVGPKLLCEQKAPQVTKEGFLEEFGFEVDERSESSSPTLEFEPDICDCCRPCKSKTQQMLEKNQQMLEEILARLKHLETNTASKSFETETRFSMEKLKCDVQETNTVVRRMYAAAPNPDSGPNFSIMPKEKVAQIKALRGKNMRKFALDLERILYERQPEELRKTVDKRLATLDRIEFIRQCVFYFYEIREENKDEVWALVRAALNSRVRRSRSTPKPLDERDPYYYESD
ncbi:unnamed protein product [Nippostrongylus brasiliensis]|uniref:Uncharacterized protein n=1 Tax=Nippostrongylus brasiliensis TaxID=27835 RepID=A0A0N4YXZ4_NIPBR|nr:hypothetical protein Q1695_000823 [Nippostrongylus brasiliensis]VDL86710.1 unnamed protein product [Nippostrongylus brasiliensis]